MKHLLIVAVLATAACGGDDSAEGDVECSGASCVCPASGDCRVECTADCDLQCAGSGDCDFTCGADCAAACTGSGACMVTVGTASTVACTGSGVCDVLCLGDCEVTCPGSSTCIVECADGVSCGLSGCAPTSCPGGIAVCNGACPP